MPQVALMLYKRFQSSFCATLNATLSAKTSSRFFLLVFNCNPHLYLKRKAADNSAANLLKKKLKG